MSIDQETAQSPHSEIRNRERDAIMSVVITGKISKFTHWKYQVNIDQETTQSPHSEIRYKERDAIMSVVIKR